MATAKELVSIYLLFTIMCLCLSYSNAQFMLRRINGHQFEDSQRLLQELKDLDLPVTRFQALERNEKKVKPRELRGDGGHSQVINHLYKPQLSCDLSEDGSCCRKLKVFNLSKSLAPKTSCHSKPHSEVSDRRPHRSTNSNGSELREMMNSYQKLYEDLRAREVRGNSERYLY